MKDKLLLLYPDFNVVHGPYKRKDGRLHAVLYNNKTFRKRTISWPKALVEVREGRKLTADETVDHNDRDFTNDSLDNLIIRNRKDHGKLDAKRLDRPEMPCVWCGKILKLTRDRIVKKEGKAGPFCSKKCTGEYGAAVQNGKERIKCIPLQRVYYNLSKRA